jgi:DNA-binding CsgD family transcriptional regulator
MHRLPSIYDDAAIWLGATPVLTARDRELLEHLKAGRSHRQISAAMTITINTVRGRIRGLDRKLDLATGCEENHGRFSPRGTDPAPRTELCEIR